MENPNIGGPIPPQEVRVELTALSSMARAKEWSHSPRARLVWTRRTP